MAALRALAAASGGRYRPAAIAAAHAAATDPGCVGLAARGAPYPDHVVFLGAGPVPVLPADGAVPALTELLAGGPALVLASGSGALVRADLTAGAEEMAACLGLVLLRLPADAPLVTLNQQQEAELLDWDAEKYRQSLCAPPR